MMKESLTQSLKRAAQVRANGTATLCGTRRRNWAESVERVARAAAGLRQLGVSEGDRVGILALNSDRYFESYYAVPWAGAIMLPLNTRLTAADLAYMLNDSEALVLCLDEAFIDLLPGLREYCPTLKHVVYLGDGPMPVDGMVGWDDLVARSEPMADAGRSGDDIADGLPYRHPAEARDRR
jgi:acyl-CoA synthetase (AMP-forming)/AMP-acid ligase II